MRLLLPPPEYEVDTRTEALYKTWGSSRNVRVQDLDCCGLASDWLLGLFLDEGAAVAEAVIGASPCTQLWKGCKRAAGPGAGADIRVRLHPDVLDCAAACVRTAWWFLRPRFSMKCGPFEVKDPAGGRSSGLDGILEVASGGGLLWAAGQNLPVFGTVNFELQCVRQCTVAAQLQLKRLQKRRDVRTCLKKLHGARDDMKPRAAALAAEFVLVLTLEVGVNGNGTLVQGRPRLNAELLRVAELLEKPADQATPVAEAGWTAGKIEPNAAPKRVRLHPERELEPKKQRKGPDMAGVLGDISELARVRGIRGDVVLFVDDAAMRFRKARAEHKLRQCIKECCDKWRWDYPWEGGGEIWQEQLSTGGLPRYVCRRGVLRAAHKAEFEL